jgi:hypothetical protein
MEAERFHAERRTDGRTIVTMLIAAFRKVANVPKIAARTQVFHCFALQHKHKTLYFPSFHPSFIPQTLPLQQPTRKISGLFLQTFRAIKILCFVINVAALFTLTQTDFMLYILSFLQALKFELFI